MKFDNNLEVEVRAIPYYYFLSKNVAYHEIQYRIKPYQLNWFQRTFCNFWDYIPYCVYDECFNLHVYEPATSFQKYKDMFKTLGDVRKFGYEQEQLAEKRKQEHIEEEEKKRKTYY